MISTRGLLVLAAIGLALSAGLAPGQVAMGTWSAASGGNGHTYQVFLAAVPWGMANSAAVGLGGYLASVTTGSENEFIYGLISGIPALWVSSANGTGSYGPWLGGTLTATGWTWASGEPFCYAHWAPGEPNNGCIGGPTEDHIHYGIGANSSSGPVPIDNWNDLFAAGCVSGGIYPPGYVVELETFDLTLTQFGVPGAPVSIINAGPPGNLYFNVFTVVPDPCLDGWFFGLEVPLFGLLSLGAQLSFGPPFFGVIPASGTDVAVVPGLPTGFLVNYVSLQVNPAVGGLAGASRPKTIVTI
jgi:hypothetical protein